MITNKNYQDLMLIQDFDSRIEYLACLQIVGEATFGGKRPLNQMLYKMPEWKSARRQAILRDNGFDLAHPDHPIFGNIYVHHIIPITPEDILKRRYCVLDLNNLICCSLSTHNAIHYGKDIKKKEPEIVIERSFGDTTLW